MKKRICFVVQRYGLEINGGAELHCRQLAEHLLPYYEVDVLTDKAIDYMTWADEYKESRENINGINVIRFSVEKPRDMAEFDLISSELLNSNFFFGYKNADEKELEWIEKQGPLVPELITYLKDNADDYEAIIFFTYLYYPTAMGVREVREKAIVIPTAHEEPYLNMKIYENVFKIPKAFFYNTIEEKEMIIQKFENENIKSDIGGVGVDVPGKISATEFKKKYGLSNYIIYVGRIDDGKNCKQLFEHFEEHKKRNPGSLKLVLMGKATIDVPQREDVINMGFVSDEDKFNGIAGAKALVLPSRFESLSMVVLEALSLKTPVLVNGECKVLKGHCIKGQAGLYYENYFQFEGALNYLLKHRIKSFIMGYNGASYVKKNYQWNVIIKKLIKLIDYVSEDNQAG